MDSEYHLKGKKKSSVNYIGAKMVLAYFPDNLVHCMLDIVHIDPVYMHTLCHN